MPPSSATRTASVPAATLVCGDDGAEIAEPPSLRLRIALTVDPEIPVPPRFYGGIERIVDMLVRGLLQRGHEVVLFANPASTVACELAPYPGRKSQSKADTIANMWHVCRAIQRGHFDVVHSFSRLAYLLPLLPLSIPKIMSYQRAITPRSVWLGNLLSRGSLTFTGCGAHLIEPWRSRPNFRVIYNGVPLEKYRSVRCLDANHAPLIYLGRIEEIKGVHLAIEVAQRSGRSLLIAGNVPREQHHRRYFAERIQPKIDGESVVYVGEVDDAQKNQFLGRAAAMLMPLMWEEPFGIVMTEALACGTPVIGLRRGSLPEIVEDGVNGFVCDSVAAMVAAVGRLGEIDRGECRRVAEARFSDRVIVACYERLYMELVAAR